MFARYVCQSAGFLSTLALSLSAVARRHNLQLMATEDFWQKRRRQLFDPVIGGVFYYVPMQEAALAANGPMFANQDVVELLVLGHQVEASAILDYVPRLEALARAARGSAPESANCLPLSELSFGIWLRTDIFDHEIATWAFSARHDYAIKMKQIEGPTLTSLLILALECDDDEAAWSIYQSHHKAPLDQVPQNKRQLAGPQHLLGLTSRVGVDPSGKDRLLEALKSFTLRARHWDKRIDPVPYISIIYLTRILIQCLRRLDKPPSREELWALIR